MSTDDDSDETESDQRDHQVSKYSIEKLEKEFFDYMVPRDKLQIMEKIGKGGFAIVNRAKVLNEAQSIVAVKELRGKSNIIKSFCREVQIQASGRNFFLLPLYGFCTSSPYLIVTEYMPNGTLRNILSSTSGKALSGEEKLKIAFGVVRGMMSLHRQDIIHRDLKSHNILLDAENLPKICDFGISRQCDANAREVTRGIGSTAWMAPERFQNEDYTYKVDVYAFGVLVWEILTGQVPFTGIGPYKIAGMVTGNERPPLPEKMSTDMRQFIDLCWHQDPECRPSFAQICALLTRKVIRFPGDLTASVIDDFLREFPFTEDECEFMDTSLVEGSQEFEAAFETPDDWNPRRFFHKDSRIETIVNPLFSACDTVDPNEAWTATSDIDVGGLNFDPMSNRFLLDIDEIAARPESVDTKINSHTSRDKNIFLTAPPTSLYRMVNGSKRMDQGSVHMLFNILAKEGLSPRVCDALSEVMTMNPGIVAPFLGRHGLKCLRFSDKACFRANILILIACARYDIKSIEKVAVKKLLRLRGDNASLLLQLFAVVIRVRDKACIVIEVIRVYLKYWLLFFETPEHAELYVRAVYRVASNDELSELRRACIEIFMNGIIIRNGFGNVIIECCNALCFMELSESDINVDHMTALLMDRRYCAAAVDVLARVDEIPISDKMIAALVEVGGESLMTASCLMNIAKTEEGCRHLISFDKWMENIDISDAVTIMFCVFKVEETRQLLLKADRMRHMLILATKADSELYAPVMRFISVYFPTLVAGVGKDL